MQCEKRSNTGKYGPGKTPYSNIFQAVFYVVSQNTHISKNAHMGQRIQEWTK